MEILNEESQSKEEEEAFTMIRGKHQLRWQFNSSTYQGEPVRFNLDNGDYDRNFVVESIEVIWCSMDKTTNNTDISEKTHQVVLATSEAGAQPTNTETVNNRPYAMRVTDRRQIGWAQMNADMVNTMLDPHNIITQDLWLCAWAWGSAHDPDTLDQDIGILITLNEVRQSGNQALLTWTRDAGSD